jgi:hypothetical protein
MQQPIPMYPAPPSHTGRNIFLGIIGGISFSVLLCCGLSVLMAANSPSTASSAPSVATASSGSKPAVVVPPTAPVMHAPGEAVQAGDWNVTVSGIDHPGKTLVWSQYGNKTEAKGEWLVIKLDLVNRGTRNWTMNDHDWSLVDANGVKYDTSTAAGVYSYPGFKKLTSMGDQIPPNTPVSSALVYDIAPGTTGLTLTLKDTKTSFVLG